MIISKIFIRIFDIIMDANPTLDQLQVFLTVADTGSFSVAAQRLNRAQSVISYTIANLEAQLQIGLFERGAARRAQLTVAGRALVDDARRIVGDLRLLRARVSGLRAGMEAEIAIALSNLVPSQAVVTVLQAFRTQFPTVTVTVSVGELGMVMRAVADGKADIGFGGKVVGGDDRLVADRIGHSFMVPVASADHPLVQLGRPLTLDDVRDVVQLVVTDASGLTQGRDFNVLSYRVWRVSDIHSKRLLALGGLGWGGLPISLVAEDLQAGRLAILPLRAYEHGEYPLYAIHRTEEVPGPASRWLIEQFRDALSYCPGPERMTALLQALTPGAGQDTGLM